MLTQAGGKPHDTDLFSTCRSDAVSDLNALEQELNASIAAAADEAALEAVRVAALGRKGSVSELLKTLGTMTPDQRRERVRRSTASRIGSRPRSPSRKAALADQALEKRLNTETVDVTLRCWTRRPKAAAFTRSVR